jgi:hypothetical protein
MLVSSIGLVTRTTAGSDTSVQMRVDDGGVLVANVSDGGPAVSRSYTKLRAFLWIHWRERAAGKIVLKGATTEGNPYRTTYLVHPDDKGIWRIAVESEGEYFDSFSEKSEHWSKRYEAYSVERVVVQKREAASEIFVSDDARVATKAYRLVLKDRGGKIVQESL